MLVVQPELNIHKTKIWKGTRHFGKLKLKIPIDALHKVGINNSMAY